MAESTLQSLFGPLNRKYCLWFYYLSIMGFVLFILMLISSVYIGITRRKGLDFYIQMLSPALVYAIVYFQNRLLYTMCSSSL